MREVGAGEKVYALDLRVPSEAVEIKVPTCGVCVPRVDVQVGGVAHGRIVPHATSKPDSAKGGHSEGDVSEDLPLVDGYRADSVARFARRTGVARTDREDVLHTLSDAPKDRVARLARAVLGRAVRVQTIE